MVRVTVVVSLDCERRGAGVDWDEWLRVTVEAMVVSVGVPGGNNELMNSVGDSVVGEDRRELSRTDAVLRDDCGVLSLVGCIALELLLGPLGGLCPAVFVERLEAEDCVVTREETWVFAEDHISVSVRGDLDLLERDGSGLEEGRVGSSSMSIASVGVRRARRGGVAEMSSALRVRVEPGCWVGSVSCVSDDMVEGRADNAEDRMCIGMVSADELSGKLRRREKTDLVY